jgi:hypothetical protein
LQNGGLIVTLSTVHGDLIDYRREGKLEKQPALVTDRARIRTPYLLVGGGEQRRTGYRDQIMMVTLGPGNPCRKHAAAQILGEGFPRANRLDRNAA